MAMRATMQDYFWMSQRSIRSILLIGCFFATGNFMYIKIRNSEIAQRRNGEIAYTDRTHTQLFV